MPTFNRDQARRMMEEGMRRQAEKTRIDQWIAEQRAEYEANGFEVHRHGELKKEAYIDVKVTEAKVDQDFYDRS